MLNAFPWRERLEVERRWNCMPQGCKSWMEHGMGPWQQDASPHGRDDDMEDPGSVRFVVATNGMQGGSPSNAGASRSGMCLTWL